MVVWQEMSRICCNISELSCKRHTDSVPSQTRPRRFCICSTGSIILSHICMQARRKRTLFCDRTTDSKSQVGLFFPIFASNMKTVMAVSMTWGSRRAPLTITRLPWTLSLRTTNAPRLHHMTTPTATAAPTRQHAPLGSENNPIRNSTVSLEHSSEHSPSLSDRRFGSVQRRRPRPRPWVRRRPRPRRRLRCLIRPSPHRRLPTVLRLLFRHRSFNISRLDDVALRALAL